jgi:ubiquinone/menaquinone biosynthesis C-methylase UbiE
MENKIFMPAEHMDKLYNSKNPLVSYAHNNRLKNIYLKIKQYKKFNSEKLLDLGCGEGHLLNYLNSKIKMEYYGIDLTEVSVNSAKKRCPWAKITLGDASKTKYPNSYFDFIACTEIIEHIPNYLKVFSEMSRILKTNGYLVITFPNEFNWTVGRFMLRRKPIKVIDHFNSFSPSSLKIILTNMVNIKNQGLPFKFPFIFSLGYLMVFRKIK